MHSSWQGTALELVWTQMLGASRGVSGHLQRALGDARGGKICEHARQPGLHGVDEGGVAGQCALCRLVCGRRLRPRSVQGLCLKGADQLRTGWPSGVVLINPLFQHYLP